MIIIHYTQSAVLQTHLDNSVSGSLIMGPFSSKQPCLMTSSYEGLGTLNIRQKICIEGEKIHCLTGRKGLMKDAIELCCLKSNVISIFGSQTFLLCRRTGYWSTHFEPKLAYLLKLLLFQFSFIFTPSSRFFKRFYFSVRILNCDYFACQDYIHF